MSLPSVTNPNCWSSSGPAGVGGVTGPLDSPVAYRKPAPGGYRWHRGPLRRLPGDSCPIAAGVSRRSLHSDQPAPFGTCPRIRHAVIARYRYCVWNRARVDGFAVQSDRRPAQCRACQWQTIFKDSKIADCRAGRSFDCAAGRRWLAYSELAQPGHCRRYCLREDREDTALRYQSY